MGILPARILERVTMPSLRGSSPPRNRTEVSRIAGGFFTIWVTREVQEYWNGRPISSPGDLPSPGIEPGSPALQGSPLPAQLPGKPPLTNICADISRNAYVSAFELLAFSAVTYIPFIVMTFIWEQVCIYKKRGSHVSAPGYPSWFQGSTWFLKKLKGSNEVQG